MKRVLVVEDEASIREMVALNLKMAGWEVVEAPSAERALELITVALPAVLLLGLIDKKYRWIKMNNAGTQILNDK